MSRFLVETLPPYYSWKVFLTYDEAWQHFEKAMDAKQNCSMRLLLKPHHSYLLWTWSKNKGLHDWNMKEDD